MTKHIKMMDDNWGETVFFPPFMESCMWRCWRCKFLYVPRPRTRSSTLGWWLWSWSTSLWGPEKPLGVGRGKNWCFFSWQSDVSLVSGCVWLAFPCFFQPQHLPGLGDGSVPRASCGGFSWRRASAIRDNTRDKTPETMIFMMSNKW